MIDERKVVILGSTGSIGVQALEIIEKNPTLFKVVGLVAGGNNLELFEAQKQKFKVENSGLGISLGNDCVIESGVYITAGSKVTLPDGKTVKARELSGANNLLFRRNSQSGALEVLPKTGDWGGLNSVLHAN